jgi:peroxiredoxin
VPLVAISVDPAADSAKLAADLGLHFPLLADADLRVASAYGVAMKGRDIAVPSVFVVRRDRSIAWSKVGEDMTDRPSASEVLDQARRAVSGAEGSRVSPPPP